MNEEQLAPGAFTEELQSRRSRVRRTRGPNESLLKAIVATVPIDKLVMDIGAGNGTYVQALRKLGYKITGVDGTSGIHELTGGLVRHADLTGNCRHLFDSTDWGLCIEVGEHVPKELEQRFIDAVGGIPFEGLIITWASPGQRGSGHVNCRTPVYVAAEFARRGWRVDDGATVEARGLCDKHYNKRLIVLRRR